MSPKPVSIHRLERFIVWFYIIAFIGTIFPFSHKVFITLIPWALLFNLGIILSFHMPEFNMKSKLVFTFIAVGGFAIEAIGVNTGMIFGNYQYNSVLGVKLFNTPLIIGINWLLLVYCSAAITSLMRLSVIKKIILSSIIILAYDIILEKVAGNLGMWHWEAGIVPLRNYAAWFVIAFIFLSLIKLFKVKIWNRLAFTVFLAQIFFFLGLFISRLLVDIPLWK